MTRIDINDDFDLEKIVDSGQCFRAEKCEDGSFIFITEDHVVRIKTLSATEFLVSCPETEWENVWKEYFDLEVKYEDIRETLKTDHPFINQAIEYGKGIRILKQDPWETLISFIISQNKNIPAIKKSIRQLSENFGHPICLSDKSYYTFPTVDELSQATDTDLINCKLGYRVSYVRDAIDKVKTKQIDLEALKDKDDPGLVRELMQIKGVGIKVAHCVSLFSYGRKDLAPIDVWIKRCINKELNGISPFEKSGKNAGILQQYLYFQMRAPGN